ncbi:ParA family protein [Litoribacillus peritrichatus]|uniref:ParA family protein n=1 Tax=Litoribacillus peritrichatus TaxID=718191 RepID=A0ABP7M856_9GAMM
MRVWAVANQKGGVGKTTTAVSLAGLLADQGKRVLLVDLDPHGSMTSYFGYDPDSLEHSCFDLFQAPGAIPPELPSQLLLDTSHDHLQLLPSSTALATLERSMVGKDGMGLVISRSLATLWDDFDYAVIDSPPILGVLMINALAACSRLMIPVQCEFLALKGLERMVHTLNMVTRSRPTPLPYHIVPTMFDRRTNASLQSVKEMRVTYPDHIWEYTIPVDTQFRDASKAGLIPSRYDSEGRGIRGYAKLLKHLLSSEAS